MRYWWDSVRTFSYWRYALLSGEAAVKFFSVLGVLFLIVELADTFQIYTRDKHSKFGLIVLVAMSVGFVLITRRPVSRVRYKVPKKDLTFEVKIGDVLDEPGEVVVSSNTTFDTDMRDGLISTNSLQGQVATQFFSRQTSEIDRQLEASLANEEYKENEERPGKKKEYALGDVARITAHGKNFYFVAMSFMNADGTAYSNAKMLDEALEGFGGMWHERQNLGTW
jgi:hypothetical protein